MLLPLFTRCFKMVKTYFYIYLYTISAFKDMRVGYNYFGTETIINYLCMLITKIIYRILNVSQYVLSKAWDFLQFTDLTNNNNAGTGIFNLLNRYLWIPILLAFIVLCVNLIRSKSGEGREDLKRFSHNMITLFVVVTLLPTVFANVNNIFLDDKSKAVISVNSEECAGKIFYRHTTDYKYMYELIKKLDKEISDNKDGNSKDITSIEGKYSELLSALIEKDDQGNFVILGAGIDKKSGGKYTKNKVLSIISNASKKEKDKISKAYNYINIEEFDINQVLDKNMISKYPENSEFLDYKPVSLSGGSYSFIGLANDAKITLEAASNHKIYSQLNNKLKSMAKRDAKNNKARSDSPAAIDKVSNTFGVKEEHFRYRTDFLCVWIEMIANIFLYLSATYALLKIIWEILYNRIFISTLSAIDLTNGEKVKRALNGLLGLYISIMFVAFTLILYNSACTFLQTTIKVSGMGYSILVLMLASIALDGPNIIAKYFGIETGMRAGGSFVKGAYNAGRRAAHEAIMFKRLSNRRSGFGSKGTPTAVDKMLHPIAASKAAVKSGANKAIEGGINKLQDLGNLPKFHKHPDAMGFLKEINSDKNKRRFGNLDNEHKRNLANRLMANEDKDNLYQRALFNQATDGKNDNDTLKNIVNNSDKYLTGKDGREARELANHLSEGGQFLAAKEDILNNISKQSKDYVNSGQAKNTMEGYRMASKNAADRIPNGNYSDNTVDKVAHMSYAQANEASIAREAKKFQSHRTPKVGYEEAVQHVLKYNLGGVAPDINKKYIKDMSNTILNNSIKEKRNAGAEAFKK